MSLAAANREVYLLLIEGTKVSVPDKAGDECCAAGGAAKTNSHPK